MDEKMGTHTHRVLMNNRQNGSFSGIVDVLSFDVSEILLETEQGMLLIKGKDLHVNRLSLEKGEVDIAGKIDALSYSDVSNAHKGESLLSRIFRGCRSGWSVPAFMRSWRFYAVFFWWACFWQRVMMCCASCGALFPMEHFLSIWRIWFTGSM